MASKPDPRLIVALKAAIRGTGLSLSELGRRTNISQQQLSRFMNSPGKSITLVTAATLFDALGLQVVMPARSPILDVAPPAAKPRARRNPAG